MNVIWSINVNRNLSDWELEEYEGLLQLLAEQKISCEDDLLVWNMEKRAYFLFLLIISFCAWIEKWAGQFFRLNKFGRPWFLLVCLFLLGRLAGRNFN